MFKSKLYVDFSSQSFVFHIMGAIKLLPVCETPTVRQLEDLCKERRDMVNTPLGTYVVDMET